jgi:DNA invertase Pin-like site-specific DNA recombinase
VKEPDWRAIEHEIGAPGGYNAKRALDMDLLHAMRRKGYSYVQIADYLKSSRSTIIRRLKENGHRPSREATTEEGPDMDEPELLAVHEPEPDVSAVALVVRQKVL